MIIGNFEKTGNHFAGTIETLMFTVQAILEPISNKPTSKAPDFKLVSGIREIGAAWKKKSQETGKDYLSVIIEDPTISISCAAFPTESGGYVFIWNRERQ